MKGTEGREKIRIPLPETNFCLRPSAMLEAALQQWSVGTSPYLHIDDQHSLSRNILTSVLSRRDMRSAKLSRMTVLGLVALPEPGSMQTSVLV